MPPAGGRAGASAVGAPRPWPRPDPLPPGPQPRPRLLSPFPGQPPPLQPLPGGRDPAQGACARCGSGVRTAQWCAWAPPLHAQVPGPAPEGRLETIAAAGRSVPRKCPPRFRVCCMLGPRGPPFSCRRSSHVRVAGAGTGAGTGFAASSSQDVHRRPHQGPARGRGPHRHLRDQHGRGVPGQAHRGRGQHELPDVQHHRHVPGRPGGPAGAGLHPREQDSLPDLARHAEERADAEEHEEQEPGLGGRPGEGSHPEGPGGCQRTRARHGPGQHFPEAKIIWAAAAAAEETRRPASLVPCARRGPARPPGPAARALRRGRGRRRTSQIKVFWNTRPAWAAVLRSSCSSFWSRVGGLWQLRGGWGVAVAWPRGAPL